MQSSLLIEDLWEVPSVEIKSQGPYSAVLLFTTKAGGMRQLELNPLSGKGLELIWRDAWKAPTTITDLTELCGLLIAHNCDAEPDFGASTVNSRESFYGDDTRFGSVNHTAYCRHCGAAWVFTEREDIAISEGRFEQIVKAFSYSEIDEAVKRGTLIVDQLTWLDTQVSARKFDGTVGAKRVPERSQSQVS